MMSCPADFRFFANLFYSTLACRIDVVRFVFF